MTQGFDEGYYLGAKLAALQAIHAEWVGKDTAFLKTVLANYGFTPLSHYSLAGYKEGLAPNAFFNASEYVMAKATALFNAGNYVSIDAAKAAFYAAWTADPYLHYLAAGSKEGINPSNSFSASDYYASKLAALKISDPANWGTKTAADLKAFFDANNITPLGHYVAAGKAEGIAVTPVPANKQVTPAPVIGQTYTLTTGIDNLTGTEANDTFLALDNDDDSTTLTLGDQINGKGGVDTLKIYSETYELNLAKIQVTNIEKLHVLNFYDDWHYFDVAGRDFNEILIDLGGVENCCGVDVYNVLSKSAITLTNIYADGDDNYITFKTDNTSTVGNTNVTISNVDLSDDYEYFNTYAKFTNAATVNTTVNLLDIDDHKSGYYGGYYHDLDTGDTKNVAVNATFNIKNVLNSDYFDVYLYVEQAGGSVNNITVNLTNVDNINLYLYPDYSGSGTSKNDVVTFNLDKVLNSNKYTELYVTDAETLNINVLSNSVVESIENFVNEDGSKMGNTTVNLSLGGDLKVEDDWDLNDSAGTTENTTFNITGSGNLYIANMDDGTSNLTIAASTATGNLKIMGLEAEVVSVTTGSGNDYLQLGGYKTIVSTGKGDDTVDINGFDYGHKDAKTIDGGAGTDTIVISDGALLTTALAANISNFEVLDITGSTSGNAYDMSKEASLAAVVATGSLGDVVISNAAAGTTVSLTSASSTNSTVDSLSYALKTDTGKSDNFSLSLTAKDTEKLVNDVDGQLTVKAVTANAIETISISSNATTTDGSSTKALVAGDYVNTITLLTANAVKMLTITGAADLTLGGVAAATLTKVDASAATGNLNITLGALANTSAIAVLGGSVGDTITMTGNVAANNIIVGNGGADKITLAAAGTKETIRYAADTDSVLTGKDTTVPADGKWDSVSGYDVITNFTSGEDKIELSSALELGTGDARSAIVGKGTIGAGADLTNAQLALALQGLIGTGANFFNDGAVNRALAQVFVDEATNDDAILFIDTNADGNFSNGVDQAIYLIGSATGVLLGDVVFG